MEYLAASDIVLRCCGDYKMNQKRFNPNGIEF